LALQAQFAPVVAAALELACLARVLPTHAAHVPADQVVTPLAVAGVAAFPQVSASHKQASTPLFPPGPEELSGHLVQALDTVPK